MKNLKNIKNTLIEEIKLLKSLDYFNLIKKLEKNNFTLTNQNGYINVKPFS